MEIPSEENILMPDSERFYLYRVEMYLIHKYAPQLVDEMRVTFRNARIRRQGYIKRNDQVIATKEELFNQIQMDLTTHAPWKPKSSTHKKGSLERPNIGEDYQDRFREL